VDSVFNLSVEGEPEYFANGILVHNCLIYLARNVRFHRDCRPKVSQFGFEKQPQGLKAWDSMLRKR